MTGDDWRIVGFTLRVAALSTAFIIPPGLLVAWLLARFEWRGKSLVETAFTLPLVMPPVATGLLLLKILGRRHTFGRLLERAGIEVVFTWHAVVIAMMVMSFPFLVRGCRVAFEEVNVRTEQIARTLGARAIGEFGATILVAGNIPGRTTTLSVAIYDRVQLGKDSDAYQLLGVAVAIAFVTLWTSEMLLRRRRIIR